MLAMKTQHLTRVICPICGTEGLRSIADSYALFTFMTVLHENEDYIHLINRGRHYLARTQRNLQEEHDIRDN